jgi:hypothetical protein
MCVCVCVCNPLSDNLIEDGSKDSLSVGLCSHDRIGNLRFVDVWVLLAEGRGKCEVQFMGVGLPASCISAAADVCVCEVSCLAATSQDGHHS